MYDIPKYSLKCKETYCDVEISEEREEKDGMSEGVEERIAKSWGNEEYKDGEGLDWSDEESGWKTDEVRGMEEGKG